MSTKYDFYKIGQKYATEGLETLWKMAKSYENQFGTEAREEFEMGVISQIPQYANIDTIMTKKDEKLEEKIVAGKISGSSKPGTGVDMNRSYVGGTGTGIKHR